MSGFRQPRRSFLAWAGQGMVLLSAGGLVACGSDDDGGAGGSSDGTPGSGSPGAAVSPELRAATLETVRGSVASLAAGGASFDSAALVTAMQALPGLERVGASSRMGNVWARFTDGRMLVVPNNLEPAAAIAAPTAAQSQRRRALEAGDDLPSLLVAQQYRQLDMLGQVPVGSSPDAAHLCLDVVSAETLPNLRKMAVGRGFTLPAIQTNDAPDVGLDNGVTGLSGLSGDGVFFITACAAQSGSDDSPRTVICTGTLATEANLARHETDLDSGLLTYAVAMRGTHGAWEPVSCLAIGSEFASLNWSFPSESIGIFNLTGGGSLSDWIPVLNRAGLRHILGWEQAVSWQRLLAFADDLIQLNMATNNLDGRLLTQKAEPRLRAYGMGETLGHLINRGLSAGPGGGNAAFYLQERTAALYVNTLLPTIDYALIREGRLEFELVGQFGQRADTQGVTARIATALSEGPHFAERLLSRAADSPLQGIDALRDPLWKGDLLQTVLDEDQLARGGYVQVFNGGRCSNVVPITHWQIPFQAVTTIDELILTITITIHVRARRAWLAAGARSPAAQRCPAARRGELGAQPRRLQRQRPDQPVRRVDPHPNHDLLERRRWHRQCHWCCPCRPGRRPRLGQPAPVAVEPERPGRRRAPAAQAGGAVRHQWGLAAQLRRHRGRARRPGGGGRGHAGPSRTGLRRAMEAAGRQLRPAAAGQQHPTGAATACAPHARELAGGGTGLSAARRLRRHLKLSPATAAA